MADAEQPSAEELKPKGGVMGTMLMLGAVSLVASALGFVAPYLVINYLSASETEKTAQPPSTPAFVAFGETVVNLDDGKLTRYLRVSVTLQVDENDVQQITKDMEKNKAILKSWLLSYLSDKTMDDIRGAAGQNRLRREIHGYFNSVLFPEGDDKVQDILFEEFNIQ